MNPANIRDPNGILNYFLNAEEQRLRIVIKNDGESSIFQLAQYGARLDSTFITDTTTVCERINTFLTENENTLTQPLLTTYQGLIERKLSQINARRTGFFAFIILLFNKNRRIRLNTEYNALNQVRTTLQRIIQAGPALPGNPAANPALGVPQNPLHDPIPQPNQSPADPIPQPPPGFIPPAPPPPPPAALGGINLRRYPELPRLHSRLDNEPEQPPLPTDRLPEPEEIVAVREYISNIEASLADLKDLARQLEELESKKTKVEQQYLRMGLGIDNCTRNIKLLTTPTSENIDFITIQYPTNKGCVDVPVLTERAYVDLFPNSNHLEDAPTPNEWELTVELDDITGEASDDRPVSKAELGVAIIQAMSLPNQSSSQAGSSEGNSRFSASNAKYLNVPYMLDLYQARLQYCSKGQENFNAQNEECDRNLQAFRTHLRERSITDLDQAIAQREHHISECTRIINRREELLNPKSNQKDLIRRTASRDPSQASASGPSQKTPLTRREQIVNQFKKLFGQMQTEVQHALDLGLMQFEKLDSTEVVQRLHKTVFGKFRAEEPVQ